MKLSKILYEGVSAPKPSSSDVEDAIETATETYPEEFGEDVSRTDFELNYLGKLSVDDLRQYDDIDSWMEDVEDEDELKSFRGEKWKKLSDMWRDNPPPIVVVTGENFSLVGDGRGRVTYANYKKIPLETWELRYNPKLELQQWFKPSWEEEQEEFTRSIEDLNISNVSLEDLKDKFESGSLVSLSDDIWRRMENTDSWDIKSIEDAEHYAEMYERDLGGLLKALRDKQPLPAPIILMKPDGVPYLVAGNTRLMASRALNITPKVWMVNLHNL